MIGIINLEEIIRHCVTRDDTEIIKLFPLVCDNRENPFVHRTSVPTIKTMNGSSIDINIDSDPFLASITDPEIDIRTVRLNGCITNIQRTHTYPNYHCLFSLLSIYNIIGGPASSPESLERLTVVIKNDLEQQITALVQPYPVESILDNLNINLTYNSDQQKITLNINSMSEPAILLDRYEDIELLNMQGFEFAYPIETEKQKEQRLSYTFLYTHLVSHTSILDIFIKTILKDSDNEEKFYFCIGRDHKEGITPRCRAQIKNKSKNIFLIDLQNIQEKKPEIPGYTIGEVIGEGSYKKVYSGKSILLGDSVAIKTVNVEILGLQPNVKRAIQVKLSDDPHTSIEYKIVKILNEEAKLMLKTTRARSKNISQIYQAYYDTCNKQYVIIEELGDQTLANVLVREEKFTLSQSYRYTEQIISGMLQLHSLGFVHGDLKPENILVNADGQIRITDFGWSSQIPLLSEQYDNPKYLTNLLTSAPEIFDGKHPDEKSDIWSVGVIAYRMLTGEWPFHHGFTGTEQEWKQLPLEEKQGYARTIREQMTEERFMIIKCRNMMMTVQGKFRYGSVHSKISNDISNTRYEPSPEETNFRKLNSICEFIEIALQPVYEKRQFPSSKT